MEKVTRKSHSRSSSKSSVAEEELSAKSLAPSQITEKQSKTFCSKIHSIKTFAKKYIEETKNNPVKIILSSQEAKAKWEHIIPTAKTLKASAILQYARDKIITVQENKDPDPSIPGFCIETLEILLRYNKALGEIPVHINLGMPDT